ncbi:MAG: hypothetical protein MNPFHGCM_01479 [Gemmatimonadaceae bacterium]|nr:hypothetical protein [Gemmatimonadaceae bacterium]
MHVSFALFADAANLSQEGKLNILGVFDAVQVGQTPAIHPRAHLVVRLKGTASDAGTHDMTLRWVNPRGEELWSSAGKIDIGTPPHDVTEMDLPIIAAVDLPLDQAGTFTMEVLVDRDEAATVSLQVRSGAPFMPASNLVS